MIHTRVKIIIEKVIHTIYGKGRFVKPLEKEELLP